ASLAHVGFGSGVRRLGRRHPLPLSRQHPDRVRVSRRRRTRVLHLEMDIEGMSTRSNAGSSYMEWAKLCSAATYNLATSGMAGFPLADLGVTIEQLEINGSANNYGYPPFLQAIGRPHRLPGDVRVNAMGTPPANC